jgi:hypothetical protein
MAWACNGARRDLSEAQKACAFRACKEGAERWTATREEVAESANEARAEAKAEAVRLQERDEAGRFGPSGVIDDDTTRRDYRAEEERRTRTRLGAEIGIGRAAVEKGERNEDGTLAGCPTTDGTPGRDHQQKHAR